MQALLHWEKKYTPHISRDWLPCVRKPHLTFFSPNYENTKHTHKNDCLLSFYKWKSLWVVIWVVSRETAHGNKASILEALQTPCLLEICGMMNA